jgi:uncharacterized phage protein (TIGR01671 family)
MNREIKFRAWDKINNVVIKNCAMYSHYHFTENYQKEIEFMQFTGLKDKNGKEIYEGDILQFKSQSLLDSWAGKEMTTKVAEIYWNQEELAFYIRNKEVELKPDMRTDNNNFEIIGNIHENPELLK